MSVGLVRILKIDHKGPSKVEEDVVPRQSLRRRPRAVGLHRGRRRRHDSVVEPSPSPATSTPGGSTAAGGGGASRVSAEWSGSTGPPTEVVVRLHAPRQDANVTSAGETGGSGVVVRAEEALIVAFVLLLWIAAIALFFNRWGKIRMLEPYQPKFQQQHRQSCALADSAVPGLPGPHTGYDGLPRKMSQAARMSLSRCAPHEFATCVPCAPCAHLTLRPRQNSVFVGSNCGMALIPESPPRRSRSAADLVGIETSPRSGRASRAASLQGAGAHPLLDCAQVHARASRTSLPRPRSPRALTAV